MLRSRAGGRSISFGVCGSGDGRIRGFRLWNRSWGVVVSLEGALRGRRRGGLQHAGYHAFVLFAPGDVIVGLYAVDEVLVFGCCWC